MSSEDQLFIVEKIVEHRVRCGIIEYRVKWDGYTDLSWEPAESFQSPQLYMDYNKKNNVKMPKTNYRRDANEDKIAAQERKMREQAEQNVTVIDLEPNEDYEGIPQKVLYLRQFGDSDDMAALVKFTYGRRSHANAVFVPIEWVKENCPSLLIAFFESFLVLTADNESKQKVDENVIHGKK